MSSKTKSTYKKGSQPTSDKSASWRETQPHKKPIYIGAWPHLKWQSENFVQGQERDQEKSEEEENKGQESELFGDYFGLLPLTVWRKLKHLLVAARPNCSHHKDLNLVSKESSFQGEFSRKKWHSKRRREKDKSSIFSHMCELGILQQRPKIAVVKQ